MAASFAHGRNYQFGAGNPNGPRRPSTVTYKYQTPEGKWFSRKVQVTHNYVEPVALFYENLGKWVFQAVIDNNERPDWADNYVEGKAVKMA